MKKLSQKEKEKILMRLHWDVNVKLSEMYSLLDKDPVELENIKEVNFYCRLLTSCDWYTLLKLVSSEKIKRILSDTVIDRLYPKDIKGRFLYAREILSNSD